MGYKLTLPSEDIADSFFMIFNVSEIDKIDYSEVCEDSRDTVRRSTDGTLGVVDWFGPDIPPSVNALLTKRGPYTIGEIIQIVDTPDWNVSPNLI